MVANDARRAVKVAMDNVVSDNTHICSYEDTKTKNKKKTKNIRNEVNMDWPEFDSWDPCLPCVVYTATEETKTMQTRKSKQNKALTSNTPDNKGQKTF